jgi:hypothetical protein
MENASSGYEPRAQGTEPAPARRTRRPSTGPRTLTAGLGPRHPLTQKQVAAIRSVMRLFVEEDLGNGIQPDERTFCDACQEVRPLAGTIPYGRYLLCNACATEYEVARTGGLVPTAGRFVRDKRFGDDGPYAIEVLQEPDGRPDRTSRRGAV